VLYSLPHLEYYSSLNKLAVVILSIIIGWLYIMFIVTQINILDKSGKSSFGYLKPLTSEIIGRRSKAANLQFIVFDKG